VRNGGRGPVGCLTADVADAGRNRLDFSEDDKLFAQAPRFLGSCQVAKLFGVDATKSSDMVQSEPWARTVRIQLAKS
jgi:hypothetical protein